MTPAATRATATARAHLADAKRTADRLDQDRNDYDTEFGPTNVQLHTVAVDLGDAGAAIDVANDIDASHLSHERQARLAIDIARAQAQRRHTGEAIAVLRDAQRLAPEHLHTHHLARETMRELLSQQGRRASVELLDLARRMGIGP